MLYILNETEQFRKKACKKNVVDFKTCIVLTENNLFVIAPASVGVCASTFRTVHASRIPDRNYSKSNHMANLSWINICRFFYSIMTNVYTFCR